MTAFLFVMNKNKRISLKKFSYKLNEMKQRVERFETFANAKMALFEEVKPQIEKILKTYKITDVTYDNCYVNESDFDGSLSFKMHIEGDLSHLSQRQKDNMESKLRKIVDMPLVPISNKTINIYYK